MINVAIVGATGVVGKMFLKVLEEKNLNIDNSKGPIKTSKITTQITTKKIIYRNGEKLSEETSNTENQIHSEAFTNCPNCGAKIEDANTTNCPYCNTTLTNMKIITKKDS